MNINIPNKYIDIHFYIITNQNIINLILLIKEK